MTLRTLVASLTSFRWALRDIPKKKVTAIGLPVSWMSWQFYHKSRFRGHLSAKSANRTSAKVRGLARFRDTICLSLEPVQFPDHE